MAEEEKKEKEKSVEEIFKDAFKPGKRPEKKEEEIPASELFKDIFTPKKVEGKIGIPEEEKTEMAEEIEKRLMEKEEIPEEEKAKVEVTEEKPASETFKDLFKPEKVEEKVEEKAKVEVTEKKVEVPEEKKVVEEKAKVEVTEKKVEVPEEKKVGVEVKPPEKPTEMSVVDIMKDAYEKGLIDKNKYDEAIQKIVKRGIEGKKGFIGEIEFIERGGRPEIVLEEGEIEIPQGSTVEVVKRNGEISIVVKRGAKGKAIETEIMDLEKLTEEVEETKVEDIGKKLGKLEQMDWMEGHEEEGSIMGEVKEEVELADLRREFKVEKKGEEVSEEEVEEEKGPSFIDRIMKMVKKTTEESKSEKLRRLALENLNRIKEIKDERKAIVGVAYVLKEFLEVKFEIPHELTYLELIKELRSGEINPDLKGTLITFFKRTSIMVYANTPKMDSFSRAYNLAEKTINELS